MEKGYNIVESNVNEFPNETKQYSKCYAVIYNPVLGFNNVNN